MTNFEKNRLKHDFLNSIVIINSMTKSASSFAEKISKHKLDMDMAIVTQKQLGLFLSSMSIIRNEVSKIEKIFTQVIGEI